MASDKSHGKHCCSTSSTKRVLQPQHAIVYGRNASDDKTCHRRFRKLKEGERSYQYQTRCGRPSFSIKPKRNPNPTEPKLAKIFNVHWTVVETPLEAWVSTESSIVGIDIVQ